MEPKNPYVPLFLHTILGPDYHLYHRNIVYVQHGTPINIDNTVRNSKSGPGWDSYLRMGAFLTNFSITTAEIACFPVDLKPAFLIARFLVRRLVLLYTVIIR